MMRQEKRATRVALVTLFVLSLMLAASSGAVQAAPAEGILRGAVNINTATMEELQRLPGIGPKKAEEIIKYREKRPFRRVSQLMQVKGIGPSIYKKIRPYIVLEGPTDLHRVPDDKKDP